MNGKSIEEIFGERTCYHYTNQPIPSALFHQIYDLMKLGPTSANSNPLRIVFVQSFDEKEKLKSCVVQGNIKKVENAPVTALFAYDTKFYEKMDRLFPVNPGLKKAFEDNKEMALDTMTRNSSLQAAYFIVVARAMGLGCGPMSGSDHDAINKNFFANTNYEVNFICTLGYRSRNEEHPRLPRLSFDEACKII